jgi:hypothetical protein
MFPIIPLIFALLFRSPGDAVAYALADCDILVTPIDSPVGETVAVKWVCK